VVNFSITRKGIFGGIAAFLVSASSVSVASAQESDAADKYAALLQQIADVKLATAQKEIYINTQKQKIADIRAQIAGIPATKATVDPLLKKMAASIEDEIKKDYPFRVAERYARLDDFQETLADPAATPGQKMRKALNIYGIEVGYGNMVGAYVGNNPKTPGARFAACESDELSKACGLTDDLMRKMGYDEDGNRGLVGATVADLKEELQDGVYLHYGRLAFVYLEFDSSEAWRYSKELKDWEQLDGADVLEVRRAVRIARGQSAPGVLAAPIDLSN
jgi:hypothetical protein